MPAPARPSDRIAGVYVIPFRAHADDRGYFYEAFRRSWLPDARDMVQVNCSFSRAGALRGLHYHLRQADLWALQTGRVRAALYDLRASSPTRGTAEVLELDGRSPAGLYIPEGIAHGFYSLEDSFMTYLVDRYHDPSDELGMRWNDPALGIDWGASDPILSERDRANPSLAEIPASRRPP